IVSDPKSFPDELLISDFKLILGDTNILSTWGGSGGDGVGEISGGMQISSLSVRVSLNPCAGEWVFGWVCGWEDKVRRREDQHGKHLLVLVVSGARGHTNSHTRTALHASQDRIVGPTAGRLPSFHLCPPTCYLRYDVPATAGSTSCHKPYSNWGRGNSRTAQPEPPRLHPILLLPTMSHPVPPRGLRKSRQLRLQSVEQWINGISSDSPTYRQIALPQIDISSDSESFSDELSDSDHSATCGDTSVPSISDDDNDDDDWNCKGEEKDDYYMQQEQHLQEGYASSGDDGGSIYQLPTRIESYHDAMPPRNTTTAPRVNHLPPPPTPRRGGSNYQSPTHIRHYHGATPPRSPPFPYDRSSRDRSPLQRTSNRLSGEYKAWNVGKLHRDNFADGKSSRLHEASLRMSCPKSQARRAVRNMQKMMKRLDVGCHRTDYGTA
ncbi:unnamed protein product, partial [Mesocestoides corti]|uniref:Reverse transcriptase domain-containing protein n=1 Tax=Mesocestoides corti TaxID=53468 RepID=A0A0R3U8K9_MESCO